MRVSLIQLPVFYAIFATSALAAETTKVYEVPAFTGIEASGEFEVKIVAGAPGHSVKMTADEDVLKDLDVRVVDGVLEIGRTKSSGWQWPWENRKVSGTIEIATLTSMDVSGAVDLEVEGLKGDSFALDVSGAAKARLSGAVKSFTLDLSGAGKVEAYELKAETVVADVSGAAKVECHADKVLEANVSGVGKISYTGKPATVRQEVSGIGKITPRG